MHGNEEDQLPRPRPLSGGIWTLFSWLRRSERSSSDSISSIGSDRTVASFDFLGPTEYEINSPPLFLATNLPTDTYNKRLHDREIRRKYDRDLTIHRKYGLLKFEGYETSTLPSTCHIKSSINRNNEYPRQRRATSECLRRRAAYVPGKRRAPQPPSAVGAATLPRYKRKRPAPKPPNTIIETDKENYEHKKRMPNNKQENITCDLQSLRNDVISNHKKHEFVREHAKVSKDKSFLKQIFENRKSSSSVDTSHVKFLPSISELDKQAQEIVEINKAFKAHKGEPLNSRNNSGNPWICTKCLRKYQASVKDCLHCQSQEVKLKNDSSKRFTIHTDTNVNIISETCKNKSDEKEKLKEMLKEMKNSLPKKSKQNLENKTSASESSTLRIGETNNKEQASTSNMFPNNCKSKKLFSSHTNATKSTEIHSDILLQSINSSNKAHESQSHVTHESQVLHHSAKNVISVEKESTQRLNSVNSIKTSNVCTTFKSVEPSFPRPSSSVLVNTRQSFLLTNANQQNNLQLKSSSLVETHNVINNCKVEKPESDIVIGKSIKNDESKSCDKTKDVHTPLKISSLLNSIEVDNDNIKNHSFQHRDKALEYNNTKLEKDRLEKICRENKFASSRNQEIEQSIKSSPVILLKDKRVNPNVSSVSSSSNSITFIQKKSDQKNKVEQNDNKTVSMNSCNLNLTSSNCDEKLDNKNLEILNLHSRRRNLVNQLEQSISKGDEKIAAEAAAELAKLRLSCSVLSFSSQIIAEKSAVNVNSSEAPISCTSRIKSANEKPLELKKNDDITVKISEGKQILIENSKGTSSTNQACSRYEAAMQAGPSTSSVATDKDKLVPIQVWVEDKKTARGPVRIHIRRNAFMIDLMRHAETYLGLPINLQRWIVGKNLCTDDKTALSALAGKDLTAPFYLCLVESGTIENIQDIETGYANSIAEAASNGSNNDKSGDVYKELINLEKEAIVPNSEQFECEVCMEQCGKGEGAILRECIHTFCKNCLSDAIRHCQEPVVSCPAVDCSGSLQEREIRALLTLEEYERWLARSLVTAECGTRNTFHCRTADCSGWAFCEPGVKRFPCPVCKHTNCIPCQALHEDKTCEEYQEKLKKAVSVVENNQIDEGTQSFLNSLIRRGEALKCPECNAIITKKWGCDWVKCSACKTEICWVTKGRRWGPAGKGDTSGGCRCGVDGKRCHPTCGYCH